MHKSVPKPMRPGPPRGQSRASCVASGSRSRSVSPSARRPESALIGSLSERNRSGAEDRSTSSEKPRRQFLRIVASGAIAAPNAARGVAPPGPRPRVTQLQQDPAPAFLGWRVSGLTEQCYGLLSSPCNCAGRRYTASRRSEGLTRRRWPPWWSWELRLSGHVLRRMVERDFNEADLRAMLDAATGYRKDVVEGRLGHRDPPPTTAMGGGG